jgi:electron transfer flavoprotein alpha subunit
MSKNVLILAEIRDGNVRNVTFEALSAAKQIAEGGQVSAAVFGSKADSAVDTLAQRGADKVYVVNNSLLDQYATEAFAAAFTEVINQANPDAILLGHTALGKDLAPRVAQRLGLGLISDCTAVEVVDGTPVFTRPIYAGKAFVKKKVVSGTIFATIRPNNIAPTESDASRSAEKVEVAVNISADAVRTKVKEVVKKTAGGVDLSEAKIIVSGGRGVKSAEGFEPLKELAGVLGAAVGASRGACDAGYADYSLQIGQTGKVVTPDLYIACGISGAIQHLAGMSNSKVIVAINKDPEANIFNVADYGIVGDLFEVVPALSAALKDVLKD